MIKKVREKTKGWQIHKQLIVLILLTGMVSVLLFEVLWLNKWNIYEYVRQIPGLHDVSLDEDFGKIYEQKQQSMIYLLRKTIRQGLRRFSRFLNKEINIPEFIFMR